MIDRDDDTQAPDQPRRFATGREIYERLARPGPPHPVTLDATERAAHRHRSGQNTEREDD